MRRLSRRLGRFRKDARGVSAVEFALVAPFLFFAGVAMIDIGRAVDDRMAMDRLLGAGAAAAMNDPGAGQVFDVIEASAPANFTPGTEFTLTVERVCACPDAPGTPVGCTSACGGDAPGAYYRMEAQRTYPGMILPALPLSTSAEIRVR